MKQDYAKNPTLKKWGRHYIIIDFNIPETRLELIAFLKAHHTTTAEDLRTYKVLNKKQLQQVYLKKRIGDKLCLRSGE